MSQKKKRNKKYNHLAKVTKGNERILKNFAVMFSTSEKLAPSADGNKIKLINMQGDLMPVSQTMAAAIANFRYKWFIYLVVGCYNTKGEKELKIDPVPCTEPYLQSELVGYLNDRHDAMIDKLKAQNVNIAFYGWVAKASGDEFTDEALFNIFDKYESWGDK